MKVIDIIMTSTKLDFGHHGICMSCNCNNEVQKSVSNSTFCEAGTVRNVNRTEGSPIRTVIIRVINNFFPSQI